MAGGGVECLARKFGVEEVDEEWLITEKSRNQLDEYLKKHNLDNLDQEDMWCSTHALGQQFGNGTVGAVAFMDGHLAAATSTGGTTGKLPGRVGDSSVVGHGVFADDES